MTKCELDAKYFETRTMRKKKGAGKGYKITYAVVWREGVKPRDYLNEFAEIDRKGCGLFLCKIEMEDFTTDRYWDVPDYRDEAIRAYRDRIKAIRLSHGLSKSEVTEFMRVG